MEITELSPDQVAQGLDEEAESVYLDVRTVEEFDAGHPEGACNIPIYELDAQTRQLAPNPDFLAVARAGLSPDQTVFCGCASGVRSYQAALLLRQAGFERVFNVEAGFSGKHDMLGRTVLCGWAERGHPVAAGPDQRVGYAALRDAAGLSDE